MVLHLLLSLCSLSSSSPCFFLLPACSFSSSSPCFLLLAASRLCCCCPGLFLLPAPGISSSTGFLLGGIAAVAEAVCETAAAIVICVITAAAAAAAEMSGVVVTAAAAVRELQLRQQCRGEFETNGKMTLKGAAWPSQPTQTTSCLSEVTLTIPVSTISAQSNFSDKQTESSINHNSSWSGVGE